MRKNMKNIRVLFFMGFLLNVIMNQSILSQTEGEKKYKRVKPGAEYKTNSFNEFFLGKHWRDLWNTEIRAEIIDADKYGGGLTPLKRGGGLQTKSLRLKGKDGNEYKFRLINKDPSRSLPPELQNSVYADLLQDQVSIGLPVSPLIVYPLMKETKILSVKPEVVIMPNNDKLGHFKKDFGGRLGIIEQNPRAGKKGFNDFENADKVVNGFEIFDKTNKDNDEQVNQSEFLKARLMDVFLGDRDRHADQWQWAGYKKDGIRNWLPIPRDRDYAFGKYDGLFPWMSGLFAHSLVGFNEDYPSILELTWSGRHLDRRYLNGIEKEKWDSVAKSLKAILTDKVISDAVKQMPPEMYAKEGKKLTGMLMKRRDDLLRASQEYYDTYSNVIDVYGSNKNESAVINVINHNILELKLYKKDKKSGKLKDIPFYKRKFNVAETDEIRLYLLDGNDEVKVSGNSDNDILLRIISGKGIDKLDNKSNLNIKLYDSDRTTKINSNESIYINTSENDNADTYESKLEPLTEDRYGFWAFTPILNFNNDDGWILGGGPNFLKHGFRANPFLYFIELTGAYATTAKDYDIRINSVFNKLVENAGINFMLKASQIDFNRYYGSGNETVRIDSLSDLNYYKTNQQDIFVKSVIEYPLTTELKLNSGIVYRYSNIIEQSNNVYLVKEINPYGAGKISGMSLLAGLTFDSREKGVLPSKGIYSELTFKYFPEIFDYREDFLKIRAAINSYLHFKSFTDFNFILKGGGEIISGEYPFFEAALLGGLQNLRGYPRDRFQGDAMLFGQSEIRIKLTDMNIFLPGRLGLSVIGDIGRVFLKGEDSRKWHSAYGGGIWFNIINSLELNFTAASSPEVNRYYFNLNYGL